MTGAASGIGRASAIALAEAGATVVINHLASDDDKAGQAADLGYKAGPRDTVEPLDAEERLFSARHELTQARGNYLMARLRLAASIGRLDRDAIVKVTSTLLTDAASAHRVEEGR